MAILRLATGKRKGTTFQLDSECLIGRDNDCTVTVSEPEVSRRHARVYSDDNSFFIEDLGSSNGTLVNFERIESSVKLLENDVITVGFTSLNFTGVSETDGQGDSGLSGMPVEESAQVATATVLDLDAPGFSAPQKFRMEKFPHVIFRFSSAESMLPEYTDTISWLIDTAPLDDEQREIFLAAVREAIGNAARHGNAWDPDKRVTAEFQHLGDRLQLTVTDEGVGFDHAAVFQHAAETNAVDAARERYAQGGKGGIGLIVIQKTVDQILYNDAGNELTLVKLLPDNSEQLA